MVDTIVYSLIGLIFTSLSLILGILIYSLYSYIEEKESEKKEKLKRESKRYVVSATRKYEDGESITHWHGSDEKWIFTYDEVLTREKRISHLFDEVKVLEYKKWMVRLNPRINKSN